MNKFYYIFLLITLLICNDSKAETANKIRWSTDKNKSKIVIETSSAVSYKIFSLKSPSRIVIDLKDTKWAINNDHKKLYSNSFIKEVRHGIQDEKNLRIVLDTKSDATSIKTSSIPKDNAKSFRIVINADFPTAILKNEHTKIKQNIEIPKLMDHQSDIFSVAEQPSSPQKEPKQPLREEKPSKLEVSNNSHIINLADIIEKHDETEGDKNSIKTIFKPEEHGKIPKKAKEDVDRLTKHKEKEETEQKLIPKKQYVIVIDPGHGGNDNGATGKFYSTKEKNLTLEYALNLKKSLEKSGKYKLYLTRNSDKYTSLISRRNKARIHGADIFISLHADSNPDEKMQGVSVYTLSNEAYDQESKDLSNRENNEEIIGGLDLSKENKDIANLLIDLVKRDTKNISLKFANNVTTELKKEVKTIKDTHRFADFKVLKGIDIPAILIELGYISNKTEEDLLNKVEYREKIIRALTKAIKKHFETNDENI